MQLEFKKVILLGFDRKTTGGVAKFSAALSSPIKNALGWEDMPEWQKSAQPQGKLIASKIHLEPKSGIAVGKAITLETSLIDGFEIIRTEVKGKSAKKTKATKTELTFKVHFGDNNGAHKLENYLLTSNVDSGMVVTYEKEPENEELPGMEAAPGDTKQGELEELVKETATKRGRSPKDVQ